MSRRRIGLSLAFALSLLLALALARELRRASLTRSPEDAAPSAAALADRGALALLEDRLRWTAAGEDEQDAAIAAVAEALGAEFRLAGARRERCGAAEHRIARFLHIKSGLELALIPGGSFAMGTADLEAEWRFCQGLDPDWQRGWLEREAPRRARVRPLLIGRFEVSEADWARVAGRGVDTPLPKTNVAWAEAAGWLDLAGGGLRLATEAEWEYAARAGSRNRYFWGAEMDPAYAWFRGNSGGRLRPITDHAEHTNAFGLADCAGNAAEWCADHWTGFEGEASAHGYVVRGGSAVNGAASLRSAARSWLAGGTRVQSVGFRAARGLDELFDAEAARAPRRWILADRRLWNRASVAEQDAAIAAVAAGLAPAYELIATERHDCADLSQRIARFRHRKSGAELALIPGGSFTMGSEDGFPVERPPREVTIRKPFLLGRFELTAGQAARLRGEPSSDERPLAGLSWEAARALVDAAGDGLRLPSEAEWEYACRAGSRTPYFWGAKFDEAYAVTEAKGPRPATERARRANAFGLVDTLGNLAEWCEDDWIADYKEGPSDQAARQTRRGLARVCRGGSFRYGERSCRSASRRGAPPEQGDPGVGLRLCRSIEPP